MHHDVKKQKKQKSIIESPLSLDYVEPENVTSEEKVVHLLKNKQKENQNNKIKNTPKSTNKVLNAWNGA